MSTQQTDALRLAEILDCGSRQFNMEAVAMLEDDDTDDADWEDADYDSLRLYDEISEDSPSSQSLS